MGNEKGSVLHYERLLNLSVSEVLIQKLLESEPTRSEADFNRWKKAYVQGVVSPKLKEEHK